MEHEAAVCRGLRVKSDASQSLLIKQTKGAGCIPENAKRGQLTKN